MVYQDLHLRLKAVRFTDEQLHRINEAVEVRKGAEPVDLIKRVKEIQLESEAGALKYETIEALKEEVASSLIQRVQDLRAVRNESENQALEEWRKQKLEEIKMQEEMRKAKGNDSKTIEDMQASGMKHILEAGWSSLLDGLGLSEADPSTEQPPAMLSEDDFDEEIIPGRTPPPECHTEPHTDYDGMAVRWGLTFHVESAADCCEACLDQARAAKPGEIKCNIWVYCPQERGCFSPDKYEHKNQECWLKQGSPPRLNFKTKYDLEYRRTHPTAPVVVPWVSGVVAP